MENLLWLRENSTESRLVYSSASFFALFLFTPFAHPLFIIRYIFAPKMGSIVGLQTQNFTENCLKMIEMSFAKQQELTRSNTNEHGNVGNNVSIVQRQIYARQSVSMRGAYSSGGTMKSMRTASLDRISIFVFDVYQSINAVGFLVLSSLSGVCNSNCYMFDTVILPEWIVYTHSVHTHHITPI